MILYWNKPSVSWNPSSWSSVTPLINLNSKNWKIVSVSVEIRIHHLTSRPAILKHSGLSEWTVLLMLLLTKVIPGFDSSWEECIVICILYTYVHWFTTTWPFLGRVYCNLYFVYMRALIYDNLAIVLRHAMLLASVCLQVQNTINSLQSTMRISCGERR